MPAESIRRVQANTVLTIAMDAPHSVAQAPLMEFDLRQFKTSTRDWELAFEQAVQKRVDTRHGVYVGLSSGSAHRFRPISR